MATRDQKTKRRRLDISLRRLAKELPDFDALTTLAHIANDSLVRIDPLTQLPMQVPTTVRERVSACKEILSKTMPSLKAVEVDYSEDVVERQRVLQHMPLADVIAQLQLAEAQSEIEH